MEGIDYTDYISLPWDEIRFSFEVLGLTTIRLAEIHHCPVHVLNDMAEASEWVDHAKLTSGELNDKTNEYYKRARMKLTAAEASRSGSLNRTINGLEDRLLVQCEKLLDTYEKPNMIPETMDLQRVGNMLAKLTTTHKIFEEAIIAPAQVDRKAILEDGNNSLMLMFEDIDGEGRELPSDDKDKDASTEG